ncbi:MAG TPA: zinc ribbon domain-containing protein [Polyangia bacterium]|nr:zinc ribbon domain-containing protein [Polyangia bacterium]
MKPQTLSVESSAGAPDADDAPSPSSRRRVPALALGAVGAAVTVVYGIAAMHMRMGAPLVMMGLGGMTLVLSGVALWRVLDPLSRDEVAGAAAAPRSSGRMRELEREKQLVLKAIKEIELDYQMRKIAEPDYRDMVERYRARALRVMSDLEAGDNFRPLIERELRDRLALAEAAGANAGEAAATTAAGTCTSCGVRNDDDAQFCKKCGSKLG